MCPLTESRIAIVVSPKGPNNPLCMLGLFGCNAEHSTCIENPNPVGSTKKKYSRRNANSNHYGTIFMESFTFKNLQ